MNTEKNINTEGLHLTDFTVEYLDHPVGIDIAEPVFAWKLISDKENTFQTGYRLQIFEDNKNVIDTERVDEDQSIEVKAAYFHAKPMCRYQVQVTVWDNYERCARSETTFETGKLGTSFFSNWIEPEQEPTPCSMDGKEWFANSTTVNPFAGKKRDYQEFRPAQYIRIPVQIKKKIKKARIYATAHGVYRLMVNGTQPDNREFAPEFTAYHKQLLYQTYDVTELMQEGKNVIGIILGDGWWAGRIGVTGDSCQYGDTLGLLLEGMIEYTDGTIQTVSGEDGVSSTGPILFSDLFMGEWYDARRELTGWENVNYDDSKWKPVHKISCSMDNLEGQAAPGVQVIRKLHPVNIFTTPAGETILDFGQVLAGFVKFTLECEAGIKIKLEHTEILDENGNYYNNIIGTNKEQTIRYVTKAGYQSYRPHFTYQGFRYVKVSGWSGRISPEQFEAYVIASEMKDIGTFETSDARLNQLQSNIWWSQIGNTISIPTDCPQREKMGWTGDVMVYAQTMCFLRDAHAFLKNWIKNLTLEQRADGSVTVVVPYIEAYRHVLEEGQGVHTSCGWGDAVIIAPYALYLAYGDNRCLEENYGAMKAWLAYIKSRTENSHPEEYKTWDLEHQERSRWLWNTDFHYGDWLIPSMVLDAADGSKMRQTAYATMKYVAPAYYAFSILSILKVAQILGKNEDVKYYEELYRNVKEAYIKEYVHDDGTMDADFQGIYVIALKLGLVPDEIRPKMIEHLCEMIQSNNGCFDTGFLSVPFIMDVLCENGKRDIAYKLLYQENCPGWLYEVKQGATTLWESWGAIGNDGRVSTYSYNHYSFGCIGEWMYREIGGLSPLQPGYKQIRVAPHFDGGLTSAKVSEDTPYGIVKCEWEQIENQAVVHVTIPANTTALIELPGIKKEVGNGEYRFVVPVKHCIMDQEAEKE